MSRQFFVFSTHSLSSQRPNAETVSEALSSSVSNLSKACAIRSVFPDPIDVFYDNIVKTCGIGIWVCCFSYDPDVLLHLMEIRGVSCCCDIPLDEMQYNILCHLVVGNCYRSAQSNKNLPSGSHSNIICTGVENDTGLDRIKKSMLDTVHLDQWSQLSCSMLCYDILHCTCLDRINMAFGDR